ncbi:MAG: Kdo domain containing protein [Flavobacteriaceae bacterium]|jgi:hypothetical protein|nr:Kdo domain containing protein [Flavobacteriaceae bacterium]
MQKFLLTNKYINDKPVLHNIIDSFPNYTDILGNPERNVIKKIPFRSDFITVKSFKRPYLINKIIYKYFRKSKAIRSFEHGQKLLELGILNPEPVACVENSDLMGITSSYYISGYVPYDFTLREVYEQPDAYECVKAYARFSHYVHTKGVYIKDNTPGNTLVIRKNDSYDMYLVDLNRMEFHEELSFDIKMKSLSNNIKEQPFLDVFMEEYSRVSGYPFEDVKTRIAFFQKRFDAKIKLKARFKFIVKKLFPFSEKKQLPL